MNHSTHSFLQDNISVNIRSFIPTEGAAEYHILLWSSNPATENAKQQYTDLKATFASLLSDNIPSNSRIILKRFFVSDVANQAIFIEAGESDGPVSIVQQPPLNGCKIVMWAWIQSPGKEYYRPIFTPRLTCQEGNTEQQTRTVFNNYEKILQQQGCCITAHCIRTWLFVKDIDSHYASVVKARREKFEEIGLTAASHYLASTGIEGRDIQANINILMDAYAVTGLQPDQIQYLHALDYLSPTAKYGVTFERATAIKYGDRKHIFISGTASIDKNGDIVYPGDIRLQSERTLFNIEALLQEAGSRLEDLMQMIVYLRDIADYAVVESFFEKKCPNIPKIFVWAPVCRPGWLVEAEAIAICPDKNPEFKEL